jgi:drug/metabolite transporter (DMT)-like permease
VNSGPGYLRTTAATAFALVAFASNSVLCRLALGGKTIDPATFSTIRLASGAVMLTLIARALRNGKVAGPRGSWTSATLLFLYAAAFSFAYLSLSAGTGALILFGAVQLTMILAALRSGERPHVLEWTGLTLALAGLVVLVLPGLTAPSPAGWTLMAIAGISWGFYSLRGRGAGSPLADTTANFVRAVPLALGISLAMAGRFHVSREGALLAVASGALASGVGYVVWYAALRGLTATRAATVQLSVPVLAAAGGLLFLSERLSLRLVASAIMILGGVALAATSLGIPVQRGSADGRIGRTMDSGTAP